MHRDRVAQLWSGALLGAVVIALSSSAWACVIFVGKMTVVGNAGTGMVTAVGDTQPELDWCPGYPMGKAKASRGGSVQITVTKAGALACESHRNRLQPGTYNVNYVNGEGFTRANAKDTDNSDGTRQWASLCLNDRFDDLLRTDLVKLGTMTINELGKGSGTYAIPSAGVASGPTDEAAVCVSTAGGGEGNQVPLTIL